MECTRLQQGQWLELKIEGRLDAQWADQLDRELSSLLRDGVRQIQLQMAGINFLSSAGIRILLKYRKELVAADGHLQVVSPSEQVFSILQMTGLLALLEPSQPAANRTRSAAAVSSDNRLTFERGSMTLYHPAPSATLSLRTVGTPRLNGEGSYTAAWQLALPADTLALGLGAFGNSFIDCQTRFGEFMALGGNAITLPADGGDTPDFLAGIAEFVPSVQALYAIVCQGAFARFGQFSANTPDQPIPFSTLVASAFELCKSDCIALTLIAETDGLVGASLLRSPALADTGGLLEFPAVRDRIGLTSEPAWPRSLALVCGIALRLRSGQALDDSKARSLSGVEGSGVEGSGVEGSGVEGSGVEGSGVEGSGVEGGALSGVEGGALSGVEGGALSGVEGGALSGVEGGALSGVEGLAPFVRPYGSTQVSGHFHAAALSYRALPDGLLELAPTVTGLLKTQNLQGLFHLLHDTRPITGIGESSFLRGALWFGPATMQEETP